MKIVFFCHSLVSDWNHGNAHFLRGVASELVARGHEVVAWEPAEGWSRLHLVAAHGPGPLKDFTRAYPLLGGAARVYHAIHPAAMLEGADLVLVHEWNPPELVRAIGEQRARGGDFRLLFHDTHHRAATAPHEMARFDLAHYDGVLAYGAVLRDLYLARGWARRAWAWHEAADPLVFRPQPDVAPERDLAWIGNWGDGERSAELREFLVEPVRALGLSARVHGVRYPDEAVAELAAAGIEFGGWLPNFRAPDEFARARVTVHVPRRPYVEQLPGIPTIRVFEALACGIPLVSAAWTDAEDLFTPGEDYLVARNGEEMTAQLRRVLADPALAQSLAEHGRRTILARHTCAHRVDELLNICGELEGWDTSASYPRRVAAGIQVA